MKLCRATFADDLWLFLLPVAPGLGATSCDADVIDDPAMTGFSIFT